MLNYQKIASALVASFFAVSLCASAAAVPAQEDMRGEGRVTYYRVSTLETLEGEAITSGVIMVRDGVIEKLGKAVNVPKGARVRDFRRQGGVAMPPLVLARAAYLPRDRRSSSTDSQYLAKDSLWLSKDWGRDLMEEGVLMVGVNPPGSDLPGRTSVLRADAGYPQPEAVYDDLHLYISMAGAGSSKTKVRATIEKAEGVIQKEKDAEIAWRKERKAWEEKQKEKEEAAKKKAEAEKGEPKSADEPKPKDKDKGKEDEDKAPPETFEPPKLAKDIEAVVEWLRGQRVARVELGSASDWLHWLDLVGDRKVAYELEFVGSWRGQTNVFEVLESIAAKSVRIDIPADMQFLPTSRNRINLPAEAVNAGIEHIVLSPDNGVPNWRRDVSGLVTAGLSREIALRAMTLEPASALGLAEVIQPLKSGAPAHFVIWSGDPLDPHTEVLLVVADGEVVWDRVKEEEAKS